MRFQTFLAIFILVVGLACLGVGIYSYQGKTSTPPSPTPQIIEKLVYVTPTPQAQAAGSVSQEPEPKCRLVLQGDTIILPACSSGRWFDIGTERVVLIASGTIDHGGKKATPVGSEMKIATQLDWCGLPDWLPLAALVAKIGENGRPFVVRNGDRINSAGQHIYIGINDTQYADNTGAFTIYKR